MLSFQFINADKSIKVYCDSSGLDQLINELITLRESPDSGHIHLLSPSAGGDVLNDKNPWGEAAISEVVISFARSD